MAYSNSWGNSTAADPVTVPIAPSANDVLVGYAVNDDTSALFTLDSTGWVESGEQQVTTDSQGAVWGYKPQASGSETGAIFNPAIGLAIAGVAAFSGRDNTTPNSVTPVSAFTNTGMASPATLSVSITPAHDGCDLCIVAGWDVTANVDVTSWTATTTSGTTSAWALRQDLRSGFRNIAIFTATQTTAGAITVQVSGSFSSGQAGRHVAIFALKPAASSGVTLEGTSSVALTATSAAVVDRPLAGTSSVALSASAASTVNRPLAGTSDVAITAAGTATLTVNMAASSTVEITTVGDTVVSRPLVGTSDIALTTAGAAVVNRPLAGASDIVFSTTSALDVTTGGTTHDLAGAVDIALTTSATPEVNRPLAGSSALEITATATVHQDLVLSGVVALTVVGEATPQVSRPLTGNSDVVFTSTGDLSVPTTVALAGGVNLTLVTTGNLYTETPVVWDTSQGVAGHNAVRDDKRLHQHDTEDIQDILQMVANLWP